LFVANATDQPMDASVQLPHPGDGWRFNVEDNDGSSRMFVRTTPKDFDSPQRSIRLKLAPGEVAPITGDGIRVSFFPDSTIEASVTTVPRAKFQIVSSENESKQDHLDHTVNGKLASQGGDYSATFEITLKRPDIPSLRLELATPSVPFVVDAEKLKEDYMVESSKQQMQKATSESEKELVEKVNVAKGKTNDRQTGQSYKISLLVLATDDLKPVAGATVQVTLIRDDGGDGGFASFKTNEDGIAIVDAALWPGRYQINVRAPKDSRYRNTEFSKDESMLIVDEDAQYSPREFRLNVDEKKPSK